MRITATPVRRRAPSSRVLGGRAGRAPSHRWVAATPAARLHAAQPPATLLRGRDLLAVLAEFGACTHLDDPDDMFPAPDDQAAVERAVAICRPCPVRGHCGERARRTAATHGVWAGQLLDGEPDGEPDGADDGKHEEEVTCAS
jgi:hypothetical protein